MILEINMMMIYAILLLVVCVIIGFFGDRYVSNKKKINDALKEKEKNKGQETEIVEEKTIDSVTNTTPNDFGNSTVVSGQSNTDNSIQSNANNSIQSNTDNGIQSNTTINSNSNNVLNQDNDINNMF